MAHNVKCLYCGETFDRDVLSYVKPSGNRYAHVACYNSHCKKTHTTPTLQIFDIENTVQCCYCKQPIYLKTDTHTTISESQKLYAHISCAEAEEKREKTDEEKLLLYVQKMYDVPYVPPSIRKQLNTYASEYRFTYSGMLKALKYYYEVKNHTIDTHKYSVGVIPYVYQEAYRYYYNLWLIAQNNQTAAKNLDKPEEVEVIIPLPTRKNPLKKYFNFLEEDELIDGE